jgi:NADP-dependent alcohol dehydrogenase
MRAVELCRREGIEFLLAVGGGSVLDGTKFVAAAVPYAGDPWDFLAKRVRPVVALPLGAVLTLPATGSEMNGYAVITREEGQEKLSFGSPLLYPRFSVLDPETTFSLPPRQIANGIVDAFVHVLEQYLTFPSGAPLQDRFAEAILRTLIEEGPRSIAVPPAYEPRETVMWCAAMALNGIIGCGVPQDWSTHAIGHELTALHGLDHAQTLAIILPSLLYLKRDAKREKLLQYAERVWSIAEGSEALRIEAAIVRTREFFESVGNPTHLTTYGIGAERFVEIVQRMDRRGMFPLGERHDLGPEHVLEILSLSR